MRRRGTFYSRDFNARVGMEGEKYVWKDGENIQERQRIR